jgi:CarD family transcriptional regulator
LHKNVSHPDRSYSERVIYESAVDRLASEFSAAYGVDKKAAVSAITGTLDAKAEEKKEKELRQEAA